MRCFFFFQAEDGIRDLVRSRGLGDVYKRQVEDDTVLIYEEVDCVHVWLSFPLIMISASPYRFFTAAGVFPSLARIRSTHMKKAAVLDRTTASDAPLGSHPGRMITASIWSGYHHKTQVVSPVELETCAFGEEARVLAWSLVTVAATASTSPRLPPCRFRRRLPIPQEGPTPLPHCPR